MKIGVIGDQMIDRYWLGTIGGISAEVPIPVVKVSGKLDYAGGAGNVGANVSALSIQSVELPWNPNRTYPIKNRLIANSIQVSRWDEDDYCEPIQLKDLDQFRGVTGLIVADYAKGSITPELIVELKGWSCPIFVDTKRDPSQWIGSEAILFPNLKEYLQFKDKYEWFPRLVLKQSEKGLALMEFGTAVLSRPSLARFVTSVNGAGDTVIAAFAMAFLSGANLDWCLTFANQAAALSVEKPYTSTSTLAEINSRFGGE